MSNEKTVKKKNTQRRNKKNTNPLYVVSNDGKDVEEASNYIELFFKKMGMDSVYEFLMSYLTGLLEMVNSYPMLVEINRVLEQIVAILELAYIRFSKKFSFLG